MFKVRLYLIVFVCAALVGCGTQKPVEDAGDASKPATANATGAAAGSSKNDAADLSAKPPTGGDQSKAEPAKPVAIPESLQTPAFDYFGAKSSGKIEYKVVSPSGSGNDLTRELKLVSVSDSEAVIEETASSIGGVQKFEHVIKKDGVYSRQIRQDGSKSPLQLALPAKLSVGASWKNKTSVEILGKLTDMTSSSTVVGFEKVKVGGKTYDAVKLREEANLAGSPPQKWKTTTWLAKGVGLVKMEIEQTVKGQPTVKSTMTLK